MKISVALCTCNGEKFLREQLESILHQTVQPHEIIIGDDASSDETMGIIYEFKLRYPLIISSFEHKTRLGTLKNFESIIALCTGDVIFLCDQDDVWRTDKVDIIMRFFIENKKALLVFTDAELIDEHCSLLPKTLWDRWEFTLKLQENWKNNKYAFRDLLQNRNRVTGATVAFKSGLKNKVLPFNLPYGYWHDAWLALHAAALGGLYFLNTQLIQYRIHPAQQVGIKSTDSLKKNIEFGTISTEQMYNHMVATYPKMFQKENIGLRLLKKLARSL